jgi:glutaryl-CoA dehydrogenase
MLSKHIPKFKIAFVPFNHADPLNFASNLTPEELQIQEAAHSYAQSSLMPRILEATRKSHFDREIMREMGQLGFLGCTISDYDLPGVSYVAYGLLNREIERVDSGYRSALSVQSSLVMHPIMQFGT